MVKRLRFIFSVLVSIGVDKLIRNCTNHKTLNIFYHGVTSRDFTHISTRHINADKFEKQLQYFKKNFNIISLGQAFRMYQQGLSPVRKTITISFDDGYLNNLTVALPLLEKYKIPVTFFITSTESPPLSYFKCDERYLAEKMEIWVLMDREDIEGLSKSRFVTIGSHGTTHEDLIGLPIKSIICELDESKKLLEQCIGCRINMIAYPSGLYNDEIKDLADKSGYKYQLAVDYQTNSDKSDKRILNRFGVATSTTIGSNIIHINKAFITHGF